MKKRANQARGLATNGIRIHCEIDQSWGLCQIQEDRGGVPAYFPKKVGVLCKPERANTWCVRTRHAARNMESPDDSCED
jgi:hypothetical protein